MKNVTNVTNGINKNAIIKISISSPFSDRVHFLYTIIDEKKNICYDR